MKCEKLSPLLCVVDCEFQKEFINLSIVPFFVDSVDVECRGSACNWRYNGFNFEFHGFS